MLLAHRLLAITVFPALLLPSPTPAQPPNDLATQRAQHLRRGINTSDWFAQSSDYSVQRLRTFTTPADIRPIHQPGLHHLRPTIVAQQIRSVAPNHTIIACGARWSGLEDLLPLQPLALANIIYTFHDYEPFAFTHQGATWTDPTVQPLRNVPYPSTPENIAKNLDQ